MPALPPVKTRARNGTDITTKEHAQALANTLAGRMGPQDRDRFASICRVYFTTREGARERLIKWFESL